MMKKCLVNISALKQLILHLDKLITPGQVDLSLQWFDFAEGVNKVSDMRFHRPEDRSTDGNWTLTVSGEKKLL